MSKEDRGHPNTFIPSENDLNAQNAYAFRSMLARRRASTGRLGNGIGEPPAAPVATGGGGWGFLALLGLGVAALVIASKSDGGDEEDGGPEPRTVRGNPSLPAPGPAAPVGSFSAMMPMMAVMHVQPVAAASAPTVIVQTVSEKE
jgi:hypothetical protein